MPKPIVHLYIAKLMSDTDPCYYNADFFMGSILPDAVCSRTENTVQYKNISHILTDRTTWKKDVLESYGKIDEPSMLIKGYFAHILTDIKFTHQLFSLI